MRRVLRGKRALIASIMIIAFVSASSFAVTGAAAWTNEGPYRAVVKNILVPTSGIIGPGIPLEPAKTIDEVHIIGNGYTDPNYGDIYTRLNNVWFSYFMKAQFCMSFTLQWADAAISNWQWSFEVRSNLRGQLYYSSGSGGSFTGTYTHEYTWYPSGGSITLLPGEVITAKTYAHVHGAYFSYHPLFFGPFDWDFSASVSIWGGPSGPWI